MADNEYVSEFRLFDDLVHYFAEYGYWDITFDGMLLLVKDEKIDISHFSLPDDFESFEEYALYMDVASETVSEMFEDAELHGCHSPSVSYVLKTISDYRLDISKYRVPDRFLDFESFAKHLIQDERRAFGDLGADKDKYRYDYDGSCTF